jgi:hypothetical protein
LVVPVQSILTAPESNEEIQISIVVVVRPRIGLGADVREQIRLMPDELRRGSSDIPGNVFDLIRCWRTRRH